MSVVRTQAWRRWAVVVCGVAAMCALPAVIAALPVPGSDLSAAQLRARIMASASAPYQGYAESDVDLDLPPLPELGNVTGLLDGITDQYAWYRSPEHWRADTLTTAGEDDTYQTPQGTVLWDYARNLYTRVTGAQPVRLPRAADLLPPALARRMLGYAGSATRISTVAPQRVAGVDAAGLRLIPDDPSSTIRAVDIWADPGTGLPVQVEVFGRGGGAPVLVSRFLDLSQSRPSLAAVTPDPAPGTGYTTTTLPNVSGVLNGFGPALPDSLAGLGRSASPLPKDCGAVTAPAAGAPVKFLVPRRGARPGKPRRNVRVPPSRCAQGGLDDVAAYGAGFSRFAVLPLPAGVGTSALNAALAAGAEVKLSGGIGVLIRTPLLTVLLARSTYGGPTFLFTGAVTGALLQRAAAQLLEYA
jgi:hypothetical protein